MGPFVGVLDVVPQLLPGIGRGQRAKEAYSLADTRVVSYGGQVAKQGGETGRSEEGDEPVMVAGKLPRGRADHGGVPCRQPHLNEDRVSVDPGFPGFKTE